ncbi:MAG: potassium transporter TrkG [Bacteroidales bacterium]
MRYFLYKVRAFFNKTRAPLLMASTGIAFFCSVATLLLVGYNIGFTVTLAQKVIFFSIFRIMLLVLSLISAVRIIFSFDELVKKRTKMEWISLVLLLVTFILVYKIGSTDTFERIPFKYSYWIVIGVLIYFSLVEISKDVISVLNVNANPLKIFVISFLLLITIGTTILMLPNSTINGINFVDALFTTTSAVCVTGLNCLPFHETFTLSGQITIMLLIQMGGLGVITITTFFALFFLDGISVNSQYMIKDIISGNRSTNLIPLVTRIITVTFMIELAGAVGIYICTAPHLEMSEFDKIFFAIFHAVSAFCNAGFSTLTNNLSDPMVINISPLYVIISILIILGGIGFPILSNIIQVFHHRLHQFFRVLEGRKYRKYPRDWDMNSIIVLRTTGLLLLSGTLYFLIFECNGLLSQFTGFDKLAQAFFHAVTPRTAGFNSTNLSTIKPITFIVIVVLMWIGAAPQSTGGGIKVTTFALMIRNMTHLIKGNERVEFFGREISSLSITRAFATVTLSLIFILLAEIAIVSIEPNFSPDKILFEIVSAIGTVGLSMGITQDLQPASKLIISLLMFAGRIGVVTFLSAFIRTKREQRYSYPKADIIIS